MTLEAIVEKIKNDVPFAFSRWGDGEWLNIRKEPGMNCDGNYYYHGLGDELKKIAETRQDYYMGAQDYKLYNLLSDVENYPNQDWIDADVFHKASTDGKLLPLIDVLRDKHVVYIGNKSLLDLPFINEFIEIPYNNVWRLQNSLLTSIRSTFLTGEAEHKVYLFSAGMATNVFIDILWKENPRNTYIDVGSVFDPYVGRITRSYHKNLSIEKL